MVEKDRKLINYTFIAFCLLSLVVLLEPFTRGPFQKVVNAPIGEEPFKSILAFLIFTSFINSRQKKQIPVDFSRTFSHTFVYLSALAGILFGAMEFVGGSSAGNIFSHFSFSAIGAVLIVFWFERVRYTYKNAGFLLIGVSMLLHSVSNQYANLTSVTEENSYLVAMADFLKNNTPLVSQWDYTQMIYYIAIALILIYFWSYTIPQLRKKKTLK